MIHEQNNIKNNNYHLVNIFCTLKYIGIVLNRISVNIIIKSI